MRIVDRKTFLQLPAPLFFVRVDPMGRFPGTDMLEVKVETTEYNDFFVTDFSWSSGIDCADEVTTRRNMLDLEPATLRDTCYRDGMFDDEQLFLVYELDELKFMRDLLNQAVEVAA